MNLNDFPDELLLHVFSHIKDGATLLDTVPAVCKHWLRLAKEPQAWAGVLANCSSQNGDDVARVALHAPTLSELVLCGPPSPRLASALRRNQDLVVRDRLGVVWKDAEAAGVAPDLLELVWRSRRHLRYVSQFRLNGDKDHVNRRSVVRVISQLENIEYLDIFVSTDCDYESEFREASFTKLRHIRINFAKRAESQQSVEALASDLLRAAAHCLRSLTMSTTGKALPPALEECVLRCPRLQRLNAPLTNSSLRALLGWDLLQDATLFLHPHRPEETDDEAVACASEALRLCAGLPALRRARLYVYCYQAQPETHRLCCELLAELLSRRPEISVSLRLI